MEYNIKQIKKYIENTIVSNIEIFETIDSTNNYCKKKGMMNFENSLILSYEQTAGRGRFNKKFDSRKNNGIYMSLLLHFQDFSPELLTLKACVAVCLTLESLYGFKPNIKWVNDIFLNEKKVCGILSEVDYFQEYMVIGIGLNIYSDFDHSLNEIASSLNENKVLNYDCNEIVSTIINNLFLNIDYHLEYEKRLNTIHKNIIINNEVLYVLGINKLGFLVVQDTKNKIREISSGEIR